MSTSINDPIHTIKIHFILLARLWVLEMDVMGAPRAPLPRAEVGI
jgi:hypothetical protein